MKTGIKARLITAFIIIVTVPVAITLVALSVTLSRAQSADQINEEGLNKLIQANDRVIKEVQNNYPLLNQDRDTFSRKIKPLLLKYKLTLLLTNESGKEIYNSREDSNDIQNHKNKVASLAALSSKLFKFTTPIFIDGQVAAKAIIQVDPSGQPLRGFSNIIVSVISSFSLGFLSLLILMVIFTWYISRSILTPLSELNNAAQNISQGNLEFEIINKRDDELGKFARAFDNMRHRLKESLDKQAAYQRARKEMIAGISHDLRTPIASIKGYVEGLQDGVASNKEMFDRYLAVIKNKTEQLDRLIDDLSQFSQLELGKVTLTLTTENSAALLNDIIKNWELEFSNEPIDFKVIRPFPSVSLEVDRYRLIQVIDNLVENARRHVSKDGEITISAVQENQLIIISVSDNGTGISGEDLPHIFELFYRGERSRSRAYGGSGLGLAICKHIVEAHGGIIWAESKYGQGSVFKFTLPAGDLLERRKTPKLLNSKYLS
ncbi:ATP-binding protein [Metallumcola ferriviriculae]|uniref:histidine kinase n=1 Tax=Metallumcola ferriviriculae TaxID=3039180 RepID=A0AAU0UTC7_9FIRM|nr:ATP-binding protein [Desulfitibacteraceae bacterium MK1]